MDTKMSVDNGGVSTMVNMVKKTKDTSVKNLNVTFFDKNEEVEKGTKISLVISLGTEVKWVTVENVMGYNESDAVAAR